MSYGDYRRFKLMQLDVEMWEKVREHVQKYQTNNGAYENGYIFSPYADPNQIGVDDDQGRELFSVYGYYKQSDMDLEKLVVDVVWEYIDYSTSGIEAGQTYNVADTYAFLSMSCCLISLLMSRRSRKENSSNEAGEGL